MDHALALVDAYLQVNGFFTVKEYPLIERHRGGLREATDIDVLAVRLAHAGRVLPRQDTPAGPKMDVDALLDFAPGRAEFIIGEVKEGDGDLNPAMWRRAVLFEALRRFGICDRAGLHSAAKQLHETGQASTAAGRIRLVAFASRPSEKGAPHLDISLDHVVRFLETYIDNHWAIHRKTRFRDPALGLLSLLKKAHQST